MTGHIMTPPTLVAKWWTWGPRLLSVLRIVAAFMFIQAGTMKLFAFPAGIPPNGGTVPWMSEIGLAGILETSAEGCSSSVSSLAPSRSCWPARWRWRISRSPSPKASGPS